jgi:cytochrome c peroxidase
VGEWHTREVEFHNTGVSEDAEKFKAPTLRNIALTAPYMHDGSIATLDGVLDHYAAGGRFRDNPNKDPLIGGFELSPRDRKDLIAFLESLTDDAVLHDARFANP